MGRIALACPTCGHSRVIDEAAMPTTPVRVNCPKCQGTFSFPKGTEIPLAGSGGSAPPPALGHEKMPPSQSREGRSTATPKRKTPPPVRGRRRLLAAIGVVACGAVVIAAVWMHVFKLTPIVTEKLLFAALFSRIPPVQLIAIRALREYPTKHVAVSLVLFINLKNLQEMPHPDKPDTPEQQAQRRAVRKRDLKLAERATETLCLLTGQNFGTYFKLERYGHSWGSLSEDKWPTVLRQIDAWALQTLGGIELPVFTFGAPGAPPQPAETPGGEAAQ